MSTKEEYERMYDDFASGYRACCKRRREIDIVLDGLKDSEQKKILTAAKTGWIERLKFLDQRLAEEGEQ
jgi:hypothetical protein